MRRVEIWLDARAERGSAMVIADPDRAAPLRAFVDALSGAGCQVQLRPLAGDLPDEACHAGLIWQAVDAPLVRASALARGAGEIVGPWMHPAEALARALRHIRAAPPGAASPQLSLGELEIDLIEREARRLGQTLGLLQREYELLCFLARHSDRPQSRQTLLAAIWRLRFDPGTNVVEVHVSRLRTKLDRGFAWPMLRTVKGAGYALMTQAQAG